jgi:DNA polymerase-1
MQKMPSKTSRNKRPSRKIYKGIVHACRKLQDPVLAYGMSEFKLAGDQRISLKEAKALINEYFTAFPKIGTILNYFGNFGVTKGYIQTIWPFFRKRKFSEWKYIRPHIIEAHTSGVQYNPTLGSIERASKNMPIQGCGADMTKLATVLIRWFLNEQALNEDIKLVIQVHDQNSTIAKEEISGWWAKELTQLMEEASYFIIPNGLLKSDTNITARWSK